MSEPAIPTEQVIAQCLYRRMQEEECLIAGERQAVAYRIAEIMVSAKDLYTQLLPRLSQQITSELIMEDEISGLRMTLLHLRDLITDFDNVFLDAMFCHRQNHPEQVYDQWQQANSDDDEWTDEDLGIEAEE